MSGRPLSRAMSAAWARESAPELSRMAPEKDLIHTCNTHAVPLWMCTPLGALENGGTHS